MFCTTCGFRVEESGRFCAQCGRATGQGGEQPPQAAYATRRLSRPMYDKSIAGVCSGFARYLGVDVIVVRIVWLLVAIFTGIGFIAYPICWIIMPKDYGPAGQPQAAQAPSAAQPGSQPV